MQSAAELNGTVKGAGEDIILEVGKCQKVRQVGVCDLCLSKKGVIIIVESALDIKGAFSLIEAEVLQKDGIALDKVQVPLEVIDCYAIE